MRLFVRRFGRYSAVFEPEEATLISDLVDQVRQMLAGRRAEASGDPLARMTGMVLAPSTPPADPALARLLPDFHASDTELAAGIRMLREPDLIAMKDASAVRLLDSLPRGGGTVHLDGEVAQAWVATLNDVRLALRCPVGHHRRRLRAPRGRRPGKHGDGDLRHLSLAVGGAGLAGQRADGIAPTRPDRGGGRLSERALSGDGSVSSPH